MHLCCWGGGGEDSEAQKHRQSQQIDREISKERQAISRLLVLLLLGPSESGKSTVLKQTRLKYGASSFAPEEVAAYRRIILQNVLLIAQQLVAGMAALRLQHTIGEGKIERLLAAGKDSDFPGDLSEIIALVHSEANRLGVLSLEQANRVPLLDSVNYWFKSENLQRVCAADYAPTEADILQSRAATVGVHNHDFEVRDHTLRIVDVGGSKTQRNGWLSLFAGCSSVCFVAAIGSYYLPVESDVGINRLQDAMALFDAVINHKHLAKTPVILFLNKIDLFKKALRVHPLRTALPEYVADEKGSVEHAAGYVRSRFLDLNNHADRAIYPHFTHATDKRQLQKIIVSVTDVLLSAALSRAGME